MEEPSAGMTPAGQAPKGVTPAGGARMPAVVSPSDWQARFAQQALWTADLRHYLFKRAAIAAARRILDVGCGPGVLLPELTGSTQAEVTGLDLDLAFLNLAASQINLAASQVNLAARQIPRPQLVGGDALRLPFADRVFDISLCHFVLLWLPDPLQALVEMGRVTRPGGAVLALAEPDYGGRIDHPAPLAELGRLQAEALRRQGADPLIGRQLSGLFQRAGLVDVQTGLLGGEWHLPLARSAWESEWATLEADLFDRLTPDQLAGLRALDWEAWQTGERVLFVPTFYAIGWVK